MPGEPPLTPLPNGQIPTGEVTLLFTDLLRSKVIEQWPTITVPDELNALFPDRFQALHARFFVNRVDHFKGVIVSHSDKGSLFAFPAAEPAVQCSLQAQDFLLNADHPTRFAASRCRLGLHTTSARGIAAVDADKTSCVHALAAPGQTLLSKRTADSLEQHGAAIALGSAGLLDLGAHGREELFIAASPRPAVPPALPGPRPQAAPAAPVPPLVPSGPVRVLVAGSLSKVRNPRERETFAAACQGLGAALAAQGALITVSSLHRFTADLPVLQGANESRAGGAPLAVVLMPPAIPRATDPSVPKNAREFQLLFPHLVHQLVVLPGNWAAIREAQACEADVVIVLGGREGVRQLAEAAKRHGIPLVPVPTFGRVALEFWQAECSGPAAVGPFAQAFSKLAKSYNAKAVAKLAFDLAQARRA